MSYYNSAALNGYGDFYDDAAMEGYGDFYNSAAMDGYGMKLIKGSPQAKKYMAYLRSLRGKKTRKSMKKTKGGLLISGILGAIAIKKAIEAAKAKKALAAAQKGGGITDFLRKRLNAVTALSDREKNDIKKTRQAIAAFKRKIRGGKRLDFSSYTNAIPRSLIETAKIGMNGYPDPSLR